MKLLEKTIYASLIINLLSCGKLPENVDVYNDAARDGYYQEAYGEDSVQHYWTDVVDFFGFATSEGASSTEIATALGTTPTLYSENIGSDEPSSEYQSLLEAVGTKLIPSAVTSQCGEVVGIGPANTGFTASGSLSTVEYRYFRYKLKDSSGTTEDEIRTGLLTIPTSAGSYPIVLYGHGSVTGLGYREVTGVFDSLQTAVITASPTFPGEKMCGPTDELGTSTCEDETTVADAIATQTGAHIWDQDVNEFLGLYSCLATAIAMGTINQLDATLSSASGTYSTTTGIAANLKTIDNSYATDQPYVLFAGADRGALTAQLALARVGYYLYDASLGEDSNIASYKTGISDSSTQIYPFVSGILNLGGNYTLTMGRNQVSLHSVVTDNPLFDELPGWALLRASLFNTYREPDDETPIATIAAEIAARDMIFMEQFVPIALRDWGHASDTDEDAKGLAVTLHGTEDQIVPFTQARIGDGSRSAIQDAVEALNAETQTLPGYNHATYAFQATTDWYDCDSATDATILAACESDTDGWVWSGDSDDYNHVSDDSFLDGALASITDAQDSIINSTQDSSISITNFTTATTCISTASSSLSTASKYFAAPVFNRLSTESVYSGTYNESASTGITPASIAASFILYHVACGGTN